MEHDYTLLHSPEDVCQRCADVSFADGKQANKEVKICKRRDLNIEVNVIAEKPLRRHVAGSVPGPE